jgi:hypothetical protein
MNRSRLQDDSFPEKHRNPRRANDDEEDLKTRHREGGGSAYHGVIPFRAEPRFSRWVASVSFIC